MKNDFVERVKKYMKENEKLLTKYKLSTRVVVHFPTHRRIPAFCNFALWLLKIGRGVLDTKFNDLTKK